MKIIMNEEEYERIFNKSKSCDTCKAILRKIYYSKNGGYVVDTQEDKKFWTKSLIEYLESLI